MKNIVSVLLRELGDERGSVMPFLAVSAFVLVAFLGIALDFGRWLVAREAVITATEAASLAAGGSALRMTRFTGYWDYYDWERDSDLECDSNGNCRRVTRWVCRFQETRSRTFEGLERDLLDHDGWKQMVDTGCREGSKWIPEPPERWVEFDRPEASARAMFDRNIGNVKSLGTAVEVPKVHVYDVPGDPHYPSVAVEAEAWTPAKFLTVLGIQGFGTKRCSQAIVKGYADKVVDPCGKRPIGW